MHRPASRLFAAAFLAVPASAQTGLFDQVSPYVAQGAGAPLFLVVSSADHWQQQIRAGVSGVLEGFTFTLDLTPAGAQLRVRIRVGSGWNVGPIAFETLVTKTTDGLIEEVFVDTSSAGIALSAGEPGSEIQAPMATVILFGLISSTALNMIVVPILYERFGQRTALHA